MEKTSIVKIDLDTIQNAIAAIDTDCLLMIADKKVFKLYEKFFSQISMDIYLVEAGEDLKKFKEYEKCLEYFLEKGVHRKAHLIAFGGGTISDFAGFVAATILRGISWSVLPTTLLSMIDAGIGGKTSLNSKFGKNLIGSFHLPVNVWIEPKFLKTLDEIEYLSGLGEMVKYCFLDETIYQKSLSSQIDLEDLITSCGLFKNDIVNDDFKESGTRKRLNFGHTLGHCIEKIYKIPHGTAVFWGIVLMQNTFAHGYGLDKIKPFLSHVFEDEIGEPPWNKGSSFPIEEIINYLKKDKKILSKNEIEIIIVEEMGKPIIKKVLISDIEIKLKEKENEIINFSL